MDGCPGLQPQSIEGSHSPSVAGAHQAGTLMNLTDAAGMLSSSLRRTTCLDHKHVSWQEMSYNAQTVMDMMGRNMQVVSNQFLSDMRYRLQPSEAVHL